MFVLITGGSKNGKSHMAEAVVADYPGPRFYIATMEPFGEEAQAAIRRHRAIRSGKGFVTIEKYTDIHELLLSKNSAVLLECACNLCANEMFSEDGKTHHSENPVRERMDAIQDPARERMDIMQDPVRKILYGVDCLKKQAELLVIVTNQVGEDGMEYPGETMDYIRQMGELNRRLSERADCVIEAVCGIPVVWKGERPSCL